MFAAETPAAYPAEPPAIDRLRDAVRAVEAEMACLRACASEAPPCPSPAPPAAPADLAQALAAITHLQARITALEALLPQPHP